MPGDRPDRYAKAAASGADAVVIDLEDAVSPEAKYTAREQTHRWLAGGGEAVVRVNGTETSWFDDDIAMVGGHECAVMLPKASSASQIRGVSAQLRSQTPLVALIETAAGIVAAPEICAVDAVVRAAFGSVDLGAELGIDPDDHEALRHARSALVLGCAAAEGPPPLDGVTTTVDDDRVVSADAAWAARLGFGGKLCIHPRHVAIINDKFSSTAEQLDWAKRIVAAAGEGAVGVVDGRMVDKPVVDRATGILARAHQHKPTSTEAQEFSDANIELHRSHNNDQ